MKHGSVNVGVELGGTKVIVGASNNHADLIHRDVIATVNPVATLASVNESLEGLIEQFHVLSVGVASFGPIDLRPESTTYGEMMSTPKRGWSGVDVLGSLTIRRVTTAIDTDVNAALRAERLWGAGTTDNVVYLTVGTGIGGAVWSDGGVLHGANHSEIGHIRVPRHPDDDFPGVCSFHGDCLEGMASGTAIRQRWDVSAERLGSSKAAALLFESWYIAHAIASLCAVIPVEQVIIGGGVSKIPGLHASVSAMLEQASGGYPAVPFAAGGPEVIPPRLGDDAGVVGAIEVGRAATGT